MNRGRLDTLSFDPARKPGGGEVGCVHRDGSITYQGTHYRTLRELPASCTAFRADLPVQVQWRRHLRRLRKNVSFAALLASSLAFSVAFPAVGAPVKGATATQRVVPASVSSEASLEYFISLAGALISQDSKGHLDQLKAQLQALQAQKKALLSQILEAQHQRTAAQYLPDVVKAQAWSAKIQSLEASLAKVDLQAKEILSDIQKVKEDEERRQDEAKRGAEALNKFALALAEKPPRDAFVKTLTPAARDAAIVRARQSHDALAALVQVAALKAADANQAALDGAEKQRQLIAEQKKLRAVQTKFDSFKAATPTPTPASHNRRAIATTPK